MSVQDQFNKAVTDAAVIKLRAFLEELPSLIAARIKESATTDASPSISLKFTQNVGHEHIVDTDAYKALHDFCKQPQYFCAIKYSDFTGLTLRIRLDEPYDQSYDFARMNPPPTPEPETTSAATAKRRWYQFFKKA